GGSPPVWDATGRRCSMAGSWRDFLLDGRALDSSFRETMNQVRGATMVRDYFGKRGGPATGSVDSAGNGSRSGRWFSNGSGTPSRWNGIGRWRTGIVAERMAAPDASPVASASEARSGTGWPRIGSGAGLLTSAPGSLT